MNRAFHSKIQRVRCLLFAVALLSALVSRGDVMIDDFENASTFSRWTFSNGAEFPGATGSLARTTGYSGSGAHLNYDFTGGGAYVAASLTFVTPLTGAAMSFWVKSPAIVRVRLRVSDNTGQTFQYSLNRPIGQMDPSAWYRHVVPLDSPTSWWGGTNDGQIHYPIGSMSLLAGDALAPGAFGAVDFDNIQLLSSITLAVDPERQVITPGPADSGSMQSRLGVNIHFTSDDQALDAARSAGIQWLRMDLAWSSVESQSNVFNFNSYSNLVRSAEARGMNTLFILDYGNSIYTGTNSPTNSAQVTAFARYAENAARYFSGHSVLFEIWNEPNISFWKPAPNTNQYAALASAVIPAVKRGDPSAKILTGGLAGFDNSFLRGYLSLGGGNGADGIGVHPYLRAPETIVDSLLTMRSIVTQFVTNNPPVYDTEWGFSSTWYGDGHDPVARHRQGYMTPRRLIASWICGDPLMINYDIRDDGLESTNAEHNFGLLARDYTDKPAMQAVRTLGAFATNRVFSGFLTVDSSEVVALRLDGATNTIVAVWAFNDAADFDLGVPATATATDVIGRPLPVSLTTNGYTVTIRQTNSPIYVTVPSIGHATNVTLVATGSTWRYLDTGTNLGTNWIAPAFNDTAWPSGRAPLGYGEAGLGTTNSYGTNANNKYITTYYRKQFVARNAGAFGDLRLRLRRDDGAVIYLNGREVWVNNLPGQPAYNTLALATLSTPADETNFVATFVPPSALVEGTNVLAVEVHQAATNSGDLYLELELSGRQIWLPPTFASMPANQILALGSNVTLAVSHNGLSPFVYQWWFNQTNFLAGQTNAQLLLTNLQASQSGGYRIVVSNRFGALASPETSIIIAPPLDLQTSVITTGAVWRYRDTASDPGTNWRAPDFNDASWPSGPSQLGFGEGDEATLIASNRQWTSYFRHSFVLPDASLVESLTARLLRDDGAVVYINGTEVWRSNMPTNTAIAYSTPSSISINGTSENVWLTNTLSPAALLSGTNLVAVEIHQSDLGSTDVSFDFGMWAQMQASRRELHVRIDQGTPVLTWPYGAGQLTLVTSTNLGTNALWVPATNAIRLLNNEWTATLPPATQPQQFYRLELR